MRTSTSARFRFTRSTIKPTIRIVEMRLRVAGCLFVFFFFCKDVHRRGDSLSRVYNRCDDVNVSPKYFAVVSLFFATFGTSSGKLTIEMLCYIGVERESEGEGEGKDARRRFAPRKSPFLHASGVRAPAIFRQDMQTHTYRIHVHIPCTRARTRIRTSERKIVINRMTIGRRETSFSEKDFLLPS